MFVVSNNSLLPATSQGLVATQISGSIALHVPPDNVAPSVSISQFDNNARRSGGGYQPLSSGGGVLQVPLASANYVETGKSNGGYSDISASVGFLAQLASGEISPEVRGVFAQYEKLINYGNVKYKPSDAGKPAAPAGLFAAFVKKNIASDVDVEVSPLEQPALEQPSVDNVSANSVQLKNYSYDKGNYSADLASFTQLRIYKGAENEKQGSSLEVTV